METRLIESLGNGIKSKKEKKGNKKMYPDNQILLGKKLLSLQKKGFCVNAAEKELIKLFIINRKRLKEESIKNEYVKEKYD